MRIVRIIILLFLLSIISNTSTIMKSSTSNNVDYELSFATYFAGTGNDQNRGIFVNKDGNSYITGFTYSKDLPMKNSWNSTPTSSSDSDAFVAKFDTDGHLLFSTYLGGSTNDFGFGLTVDNQQNLYIIGETQSSDFPTKNAYQVAFKGDYDVFVTKFDKSGNLIFSTYLGGSMADHAGAIAADANGNCYVTGYTLSSDFPTKYAWNKTFSGTDSDSFVAKYSPDGELIYSTLLGGSLLDEGLGITVDADGNSYITGYTVSSNFPVLNAMQPMQGGITDAFVSKFNSTGYLKWSTYLGGSKSDVATSITTDIDGILYVSGHTKSADFPTTSNAFNRTMSSDGINEVFISKFLPNGTLTYSTYLGGNGSDVSDSLQLDLAGNMYITGSTTSTDFPITSNAYNTTSTGSLDCFVAILNKDSNLTYSSYYGGTQSDYCKGVGIDSSANIYVSGYTLSTDLPTKNALYPYSSNMFDLFLLKLSNLNIQPSSTSFMTSTSTLTTITTTLQSTITIVSNSTNEPSFNDLVSNPVVEGTIGVAVISVVVNVVLIIKRK